MRRLAMLIRDNTVDGKAVPQEGPRISTPRSTDPNDAPMHATRSHRVKTDRGDAQALMDA
jgi:hypothetical protein